MAESERDTERAAALMRPVSWVSDHERVGFASGFDAGWAAREERVAALEAVVRDWLGRYYTPSPNGEARLREVLGAE